MQIYRMKKSLRPDEKRALRQANVTPILEYFRDRLIQERELSETRRALLEKHQYVARGFIPGEDPYPLCPECRYDEHDGHASDCAIATALQGVGGE